MDLTPKDVADQLLEGKVVQQHLSASELEDVVWNVSRKLEGDEGFDLLISKKVCNSSLAQIVTYLSNELSPLF